MRDVTEAPGAERRVLEFYDFVTRELLAKAFVGHPIQIGFSLGASNSDRLSAGMCFEFRTKTIKHVALGFASLPTLFQSSKVT